MRLLFPIIALMLLSATSVLAQIKANPLGGWQVTRMEQQSTGPFCALTQSYDNGMILTLGRNMTEEYSLAVDFQKNRLDPEQSYTVTLRPGPGQTRSMELMPISERAIVVRLGWDESFFEALNVSQQLGFEVDQERFSFTLPEIRNGQTDLKSCIDGIKERATPTQVAQANAAPEPQQKPAVKSNVTPMPAGQEVEPLRAVPPGGANVLAATQPELEKQIAALRDQNKSLQSQLAAEKQRFDKAFRDTSQSNEAQELKEKIKLLEQENTALKNAPKPAAKPESGKDLEMAQRRFGEAEQEVLRIGKMLEQERKEKKELEDKLVKAEAKTPKTSPQAETLQQTLVERTSELERVRKELSDVKKQRDQNARTLEQLQTAQQTDGSFDPQAQMKITALEQQVQDLTARLNTQTQETQKMASAQSQANEIQNEATRLRLQVDEANKQLETQKSENQKMRSELASLQNQINRAPRVPAAESAQRQQQRQIARVERQQPQAARPVIPTFGQRNLQTALQQSGLPPRGTITPAGSSGQGQAFKWVTTGGLDGFADIQAIGSVNDFAALVERHIGSARSRCGGDFASIPSSQSAGRAHYEIACVGSGQSFSSSILFLTQNGQFISIAHNTAPENMDSAMDARDKVSSVLR